MASDSLRQRLRRGVRWFFGMEAALEDAAVGEEQSSGAGRVLREERLRRGMDVAEVHAATRISPAMIEIIETDDHARAPADAYVRAQIIQYARLLDLDGAALARRFFNEREARRSARCRRKRLPACRLSADELTEQHRPSPAANAFALFMGIVLVAGLFCGYTGWNPFGQYLHRQKGAVAAPTLPYHPAMPSAGVETGAKAINLEARFLKDTEVILQLDGGEVVRVIYTRQSEAVWEANRLLHIEFAESASADLWLNGRPLPFPDQPVEGRYQLDLKVEPAA